MDREVRRGVSPQKPRRSSDRLLLSDDEEPARIAHIDPADGAQRVFRDARVMARLTSPADPASLSSATFRIEDAAGVVPARLCMSPDRLVLVWTADRPLAAGVEHVVHANGICDAEGRLFAPHRSCFVPCDLASTDWPP